jgi:hypothetical protein
MWAVSCRNVLYTGRSMSTVDLSLQVRRSPTSVGAVSWGQEEWSAAGAGEHGVSVGEGGRMDRQRVRGEYFNIQPSLHLLRWFV